MMSTDPADHAIPAKGDPVQASSRLLPIDQVDFDLDAEELPFSYGTSVDLELPISVRSGDPGKQDADNLKATTLEGEGTRIVLDAEAQAPTVPAADAPTNGDIQILQ